MALRIKGNTPLPSASPDAQIEDEPVEQPVEEQAEPTSPQGMLPIAGGGQVSPEVARYLGPDAICQNCIHFLEPNTCEIVAGQIEPQGRCSLFEADAMEDGMPETELAPDMEQPTEMPPTDY